MKRITVIGFSILIFSQTSFAMYNATLGRFMQRDPIGTVPSQVTTASVQSTTSRASYTPVQDTVFNPQKQYVDGMNLYEYVGSYPITKTDPFGLCPPNTCDKWRFYLGKTTATGAIVGVMRISATVSADPVCKCMKKSSADLTYWGAGLGMGLDLTFSAAMSYVDVSTACVKVDDWKGRGSAVSAGIGLGIAGASFLGLETPVKNAFPVGGVWNPKNGEWGIDGGVLMTMGQWR